MSQVDAYCKGCQYIGTNSYGKWCRYNDVTGHVRGCPAGAGCNRYIAGPTKRVPDAAIFAHKIPEKKKKSTPVPEIQKKDKKTPMTPEEAYERDKELRRERAVKYKQKAQGKQRDAIKAFQAEHGYNNKQLAELIGIHPSHLTKWIAEYNPANWEKLEAVGIHKPEGR